MNTDYQVVCRSIVHDAQGYARAGREYILALDRLGVDVKIEPLNFGSPPARLLPTQARRINELIRKPVAQEKRKLLIYHAQPYGVDPAAERRKGFDKVIINTVWETTEVPANWFPSINQADAVMVPSLMNVKALRDSGVTVPILLIPHGADLDTFNADIPPLAVSGTEETFNFLSVFQWQHRKAPEALLQAYLEEFGAEDKVALIVKSYWGNSGVKEDQRKVHASIANFKEFIVPGKQTAPIFYTGSLLNEADMRSLYTLADIFVLPSRGEGVGLPYIEAMASSVPCIATAWGGQTDFITEQNGYLLDYELVPTQAQAEGGIAQNFFHLFTDEMKWAEPSVSHLRQLMRHAYENQEEVKAKGLEARRHMESMTWDHVGATLKARIEEVLA